VINNAWGPVMLPYDIHGTRTSAVYPVTNTFYVSPEQHSRILRSCMSKPKPDTPEDQLPITYRLICRKSNCMNHENMCDWPDESIHVFEVLINSTSVKLHRKRSYYDRDNYEHYEGNDSSVEVSNLIVAGVNKVGIKQCSCDGCYKKLNDHVLSIEVQLRETRDVILYWARSQLISEAVGKALVRQLTNVQTYSGDDELIVTSNLTIDLRCPYTFTRIKEPARGLNCRHLSCFELCNFVDA
ncbi:16549_t:CDS:2, partial [Acaulospora morrowiae]